MKRNSKKLLPKVKWDHRLRFSRKSIFVAGSGVSRVGFLESLTARNQDLHRHIEMTKRSIKNDSDQLKELVILVKGLQVRFSKESPQSFVLRHLPDSDFMKLFTKLGAIARNFEKKKDDLLSLIHKLTRLFYCSFLGEDFYQNLFLNLKNCIEQE